MEEKIFRDFDTFSRALISSKDVDPTYLIIPDIVRKFNFEPLWFTFVYVAFYNLNTAIQMCKKIPNVLGFHSNDFIKLRQGGELVNFGHERRGSQRNIERQIQMFNEIKVLICRKKEFEGKGYFSSNQRFKDFVSKFVSNHGAWAVFKIAEILEKSFPEEYSALEVPDLGLDGRDPNSNDGPVGGLRHLFGRERKFSNKFFPIWNKFGELLADDYGVNIGVIETCFCKFHKLVTGKYYIGHDIAEFVELEHVLGKNTFEEIMDKHFDSRFWEDRKGLEKPKKIVYNKTGVIIGKNYGSNLKPVDIREKILSL